MVKGNNIFQLMTGLAEEIAVLDIIVGKRSFQSQCILKVSSYTSPDIVHGKITSISQLRSQSHQLFTKVIYLTGLDSQNIPLPNSSIQLGVSTKT